MLSRAAWLLAALACSSCGGGSFWQHADPDFRPLEIRLEYVANVGAWCDQHPGARGCAIRNPVARSCTVFLAPDATACELEHELRHCAGFDHPNFATTNPGCFF